MCTGNHSFAASRTLPIRREDVIDVTPDGLVLVECARGVTVRSATGAPLG
jgi:hypothetical protein